MNDLRSLFSNPNVLIRVIVGTVFVLAGLMKALGFLSFHGLPIPWPEGVVLLVGLVELIAGSLLLFNMHVRSSASALLVIILGAIVLTKLPLFSEIGVLWALHESRLDLILLLLLIYLWRKC